ncbi:MAG TPA: PSD1 and planctomycete cytochrome C domain-containing protein [Gemmataceae bacterium]|jgi:cytochrome c553|nr:PSD1 and planctomycete cytochrome C domain-containing protein [Gemmataceae bacterium]
MRCTLSALLALIPSALWAQGKVEFNRDVRPILADHCFACHGPDDKARKAELRLDKRDAALAVIDLKKPAASELVKRITTMVKTDRMPPEKFAKPLSVAQVETLKTWVAQGAEYQGHWAFTAPVRPTVPTAGEGWAKNPIDRFVAARLAKEGMAPGREADKRLLIRRVTFDLTGLPPTPKEVDDFVADTSADAYAKVVERLLNSIRYGERMALDWMDAARYADTNGYHIDNGRDMTRWREWVIDAFHKNKRFDEFTIEQLAGDLLQGSTIAQKVASGFNRNNMINFEGGAIPEEYRTAYVVDRVNTTATVWMGLTIGCAQCHDHKFDPFTQKDFYQLYAFFNNVPENGLDGNRGNAVPVLKVPDPQQEKKIAALRAEIEEIAKRQAAAMPEVDAAQAEWEKMPRDAKTEWRQLELTKLRSKGGATFTLDKDGSTVVGGPNAATEAYTFTFRSDLPKLTAIRVEALPDDRLNEKGPGRSVNGNFVMTGIRVSLGDGKDAKPIAVRSATADFSQKEGTFDVASVLKGSPGWAIYPQTGKPHHAVFELTDAVTAGQDVTVQLQFNSHFASHQMGRFRVSATGSPTPHQAAGLPANVGAALKTEPGKRTDAQRNELRAYYRANVSPATRKLNDRVGEINKQIAEMEKNTPDAMVMQEMPKPRDTFMLVRGQYDKKGDKVTAGTPVALPGLRAMPQAANRLDLARWLVSADHPLTARVTINRYWQMFFGTGLVKTAEDFGTQGEYPSHPELLDWLAVEFRESGWDVRKLVTLIVTSATYRQSSAMTKESFGKDPENRLLARGPRFRLQAEFLRDQALAVSGLLNGEVGGKSVSPYQPAGLWEELMSRSDGANWTAQTYTQSHGKDLYRRTMYTFWKRTCPPPSLAALDAPDREVCVVRRSRTNTPLQALVLMNDPTYVEASRKLAERMLKEGGATPEERIAFAFKLATARAPQDKETAILKRIFDAQHARFAKDKPAAEKLLKVGEAPRDEKLDAIDVAAWAMVANAILNLDEVVTRN